MKPAILLILPLFFLFACQPALTAAPATQPLAVVETPTRWLSTVETPTLTPAASHTPDTLKPDTSTPTNTPLPTIPTFTPTFDAQTIVTATPAPKAECPQITPVVNPDIGFLDLSFDKLENRINAEKNILDFLNKFGAIALDKVKKPTDGYTYYVFQDLTNDGEPDIVVGAIRFYIFGCQNGRYVKLFELEDDGFLHPPRIDTLKDINRNGIPELTILLGFASQGGHAFGIYEWNGEKFASLIASDDPNYPDSGSIWVEVTGKIHYEDIDHDFVQELIVDSGIPTWETYNSGLPWRNERTYYKWNGKNYVVTHKEFAQPEFRFQAIQDGDLAVSQREYAKALDWYQQAIFSHKLKDYSPEIRHNLQINWQSHISNELTPTPVPSDPTEYPRLAAYAYYRMVILHTYLGEMDAAQVKYATLQEKFPAGSPGHPYVEMATDFWNAYQSGGKMYNACAAAIAYADAHPEILTPLGSDYHGAQSHKYVPADVCPFR